MGYNLYSFLKVWVAYDGNFVEVVPAPSSKGQHCGICGNYNRQQSDEMTVRTCRRSAMSKTLSRTGSGSASKALRNFTSHLTKEIHSLISPRTGRRGVRASMMLIVH